MTREEAKILAVVLGVSMVLAYILTKLLTGQWT